MVQTLLHLGLCCAHFLKHWLTVLLFIYLCAKAVLYFLFVLQSFTFFKTFSYFEFTCFNSKLNKLYQHNEHAFWTHFSRHLICEPIKTLSGMTHAWKLAGLPLTSPLLSQSFLQLLIFWGLTREHSLLTSQTGLLGFYWGDFNTSPVRNLRSKGYE